MVATIVFQAVLGTVLLVFGWWGRRNAAVLCPAGLAPDERQRRLRVIVRGGWACQVAGVVFYLMAVPLFVR